MAALEDNVSVLSNFMTSEYDALNKRMLDFELQLQNADPTVRKSLGDNTKLAPHWDKNIIDAKAELSAE